MVRAIVFGFIRCVDEEVLGDREWEATDSIGLDHPDKSSKRFGGFEKAIKIHN